MDDWETRPIPKVTDEGTPSRPSRRTRAHTGHGHSHLPAEPVTPRVRALLGMLLAPFALAAVVGVVLLFPTDPAPVVAGQQPVHGTVTAAQAGACAAGAEPGSSTPPGGGQPGGGQPGGEQPGGTRPGGTQPGGGQPGGTQPGGGQPGSTQPGGSEPGGSAQGSGQPGSEPPADTQLSTSQPGSSAQSSGQPGSEPPGATQLRNSQPGGSAQGDSEPSDGTQLSSSQPGSSAQASSHPGSHPQGDTQPGDSQPGGGLLSFGEPRGGLLSVGAAVDGARGGPSAQQQAPGECLTITVSLSDGPAKGSDIRSTVPLEPSTPRFAVGDDVVLAYSGGDPLDGRSYQVVDFQRGFPLLLLAGLFALAVVVLGRWQGVRALVALGVSVAVLAFFVLPAIVGGGSPLLVAIAGAGVIMFVALYLTHGFSARTSTALLGTMVSLALIGVLSAAFSAFARLTGLDEDTANLLGSLDRELDTRGLLLAGIVIGALGVLDDVTVTQASAVWELRAADPSMGWRRLYAAGLRIGRDHVSSAVNTLVMAYAGAALPVLLYSSISGVGLGTVLGSQSIAQEIVRTMVGSIGLVAAVPVTTALAALVAVREPAPETDRR